MNHHQPPADDPPESVVGPIDPPLDHRHAAHPWADDLQQRGRQLRKGHQSLDVVLSTWAHDRLVGGGLLASALAFRLFLWLLPAALMLVGGLGFLPPSDTAGDGSTTSGLEAFATTAIEQAAASSHRAQWVALALGFVLLMWASLALSNALTAAIALCWRLPIPVRPLAVQLRAVIVLTLSLLLALGSAVLASHLRATSFALSVVTDIGMAAVWTFLWWRFQLVLPHRPTVARRQLWPGAIMMGVGFQVLHVFTVLFLGIRFSSASSLYGALGGAATLLLWSYLSARLILASVTLNAVLAGRSP